MSQQLSDALHQHLWSDWTVPFFDAVLPAAFHQLRKENKSLMFFVEESEDNDTAKTDRNALIQKFVVCISQDPSVTLLDDATRDVFNYMRNQSQIMVAKATLDPWLAKIVDSEVFVQYFRSYLQLICSTKDRDYLRNPKNRPVANLIKLHMLVWNVSDRLQSFAFKLVSADVHFHLIQLLRKPQLHPSVCHIEQNARLLIHSCIGILHNIINHIPQTRGAYRNSDAVRALTAFVTGGDLNILRFSNNSGSPPDNTSSIHYLSLRISALLLLAFLVDESENDTLHATEIHMVYLIAALEDALYFPPTYYSRTYGYRATELLQGLQHLAGPDRNKRLLIRNNALKVIETSLNEAVKMKYPHTPMDFTHEVVESAVSPDALAVATLEFLWALTFVAESHQSLAPGSDFRRLFERFATERGWSNDCQLVAKGILWTLGTSSGGLASQQPQTIEEMMAEDRRHHRLIGHIMISYQHSTKPIMLKVRDELKKRGYDVWMDVDYMRGSFVDAMADAIENAAALVLGVSQSFKNSPHCRQEVRYAYKLGVPLYPLQLEPDFTADGWLGLVLATIIYIPLTEDSMIESAVEQLATQLGDIGRCSPSYPDAVDIPEFLRFGSLMTSFSSFSDQYPLYTRENRRPSVAAESAQASLLRDNNESQKCLNASPSSGDASSKAELQPVTQMNADELVAASPTLLLPNASNLRQVYGSLATWTTQDVSKWLARHGLSAYEKALSDLDGPLLAELARLRLAAPESLSFSLRRDLNMGFMDQLRLHRALALLAFESHPGL
ncbi:TIR domain [Fasciola hepatica]|uniref:TIR domain n=1 Tax=Fasciola hepatica TaxID=6192 RepID=A0A4E0R0M9_FASHE|nr:TIR domain [Fasciola hepatica]